MLMGLSYNNKPQMGIIGTPFKIIGNVKTFDPVITIGSVK